MSSNADTDPPAQGNASKPTSEASDTEKGTVEASNVASPPPYDAHKSQATSDNKPEQVKPKGFFGKLTRSKPRNSDQYALVPSTPMEPTQPGRSPRRSGYDLPASLTNEYVRPPFLQPVSSLYDWSLDAHHQSNGESMCTLPTSYCQSRYTALRARFDDNLRRAEKHFRDINDFTRRGIESFESSRNELYETREKTLAAEYRRDLKKIKQDAEQETQEGLQELREALEEKQAVVKALQRHIAYLEQQLNEREEPSTAPLKEHADCQTDVDLGEDID